MTDDAIEREVFIRADIGHVWSLVSKAGFWIGDELHFEAEAGVGETVVVDTGRYGPISVRVDRLEPPGYAAYRGWVGAFPAVEPNATNSTLVEFTLVEQDGGVLVRVRESGFATLAGSQAEREAQRDANVAGWASQMELLRRVAEGAQSR